MTVKESIIRNLEGLSQKELVDVAGFVFRLNKAAQQRQADALNRLHGCLNEEEGDAFESALAGSRRVETYG